MTTLKMMLICAGSLVVLSCTPGEKSNGIEASASGTYVNQYVIEVSNPHSGEKVGTRQIRDSIFVESSESGFKVSNRKWRMNDYDQEGWVSMAHADDRPLPTFFASYDHQSGSLKPASSDLSQSIFIDKETGNLYKDTSKKVPYIKVQ
jgi:hypothetical protein